jgi:hypothetical protein
MANASTAAPAGAFLSLNATDPLDCVVMIR